MNIKIKTKVVSVKVSPENRRVIVKVSWEIRGIFMYNSDESTDIGTLLGYTALDFLHDRFKGVSTGIAVCHENDTFDAEKGEKIARAKAETKAYFKASKALIGTIRKQAEALQKVSDAVYAFTVKTAGNSEHNALYIKKLTQSQQEETEK